MVAIIVTVPILSVLSDSEKLDIQRTVDYLKLTKHEHLLNGRAIAYM